MRQRWVIGNWKMHGSRSDITALCQALRKGLDTEAGSTTAGVMPTALHLGLVQQLLDGSAIKLGAQHFSPQASGAFTGEVSVAMLAEFGVSLGLVGHSERRQLFAETNRGITEKFVAACDAGIRPVLCVGESLAERESGDTETVVLQQLNAVLENVELAKIRGAVIAYEPVWAIGTGKTATPEQAQSVHGLIRQRLAQLDAELAAETAILYGGSVKAGNAEELFARADIDGGLVGGASLDAAEFIQIFKHCQSSKPS